MKRTILLLSLALALILSLAACGGDQEAPAPEAPPAEEIETVLDEVLEPAPQERETYPDIEELFSSVIPDSEIGVTLRNEKTLHAKITTNLPPDAVPDGWQDMLEAFGAALSSADEKKADYGASLVSAEILADDKSILASGFDGKVQFTKFEERDFEAREIETSFDPAGDVSEALDEVYDKLDEVSVNMAEAASGAASASGSSSVVYVSNRSNTIHSTSSCSGMTNYREMSAEDAAAKGYKYCPNCW